ncbi:hypothetical protein Zmor_011343 [Zophobas morio]|uniref:Uncharacterized protein n=1 Tax=Zophobas morio TaxID=2755281 RepID=A0AA38IKL1_9CUCU|nr:hypothetical protein Zmor_011343 [Zophobas morio]
MIYLPNCDDRFLDLVCPNLKCNVQHDVSALLPESRYHPALLTTFCVPHHTNSNSPTLCDILRYSFKKADFTGLYNAMIEVNWDFLDNINSADEICELFYVKLYELFDRFVPKTKPKKGSFPIWFTADLIRKINSKDKLFKKYKKFNTQSCLEEYRNIRRQIKLDSNVAYKNYIHNVESKLINDPRKFWMCVNTKRKDMSTPGSKSLDNERLESPQEIANAFSSHFSNSYVQSSVVIMVSLQTLAFLQALV